MAAVFRSSANLAATLTLLGLAGVLICLIGWWWFSPRTDYARHVDWIVDQPVPFSHQHHVAGLGMIADLPHRRGGFIQCGDASHIHLHDLPLPNLDERPDSSPRAT